VSKSVEELIVEIHGIRNSVCIRKTTIQTGIDEPGRVFSDSCEGCKRRNFSISLHVLCILSRFDESSSISEFCASHDQNWPTGHL